MDLDLDLDHCDLGRTLTGDTAANYMAAMRVIAANPGATNMAVSEAIHRPLGSMGVPCRAARHTLGISDSRGVGPTRVEDPDRYLAGCAALGIEPQKGNTFAKTNDPAQVEGSNVRVDPMQDVRRLVRQLRDQMSSLDIDRIEITTDDVQVTRTVRTQTTIRL